MEIAIVGTGNVAQKNYLPSLLRHQDVSVTCYSRTAARAEQVAQEFKVRYARTLEELFERQPDAVLVLTREEQRLEATNALLPFKPKRLFFEKPLTARQGQACVAQEDFGDGKDLLLRAREIGTETAMVFNYRFFDQTQRAKRLIQERDFGKPVNVVALVHYACWSHCIDLILHFAGPVVEISAQEGAEARPCLGNVKAPDVAASFCAGENTTGTILGTGGIDFGSPLFELTFGFERGRFHLRGLDEEMEVLDYSSDVHEVLAPSRAASRWDKYGESFAKAVDAYLDSIRQGAPPPVPGIAGLLELQFEAALKKSVAEGRPVALSDEFPLDPLSEKGQR